MQERLSFYTPPYTNITSYFEMVDLACKYGIEYLETLNILDFSEPDLEVAKKLREYADIRGVKFCCVSVGINLVGDDREKNIEKVKKFVDIAVILGSPYIHHTIVFEFEDPDKVVCDETLYFESGIEAVRQIHDYAKSRGIKSMCEEQGFIFNGAERFKRFLNVIDRDIGVVADVGNIMFVDEKADSFFPLVKDKILHAHVKDFKKVKEGTYKTRGGNYLDDCSLGCGDADVKSALEYLKKIGYNGLISLECMMVEASDEKTLVDNINYAKECLK